MDPTRFIRPGVRGMEGYVPGEQPPESEGLVKLNTNENPYDPPKEVLQAIQEAMRSNLRLYPEPSSTMVRGAVADAYGILADQVVVGNGSDDILTMILRSFIDVGEVVAAPTPTYTLYETLTRIQGGAYRAVPWAADGSLPVVELLATGAKVVFVVRPNAPTGHVFPLEQVSELCRGLSGVVVLDEAYVDFAEDHGVGLLPHHANLLITRTFSKSMAMAGMRVGLGLMDRRLAMEFHKVRDSYNVNRISQIAAREALRHRSEYGLIWEKIKLERGRVTLALRQRGFRVGESQANFILAAVPEGGLSASGWLRALRERGVHVRYFAHDPLLRDTLRITMGRPEEMGRLLEVVDEIIAT